MDVVVGSTNPVKKRAVERIVAEFDGSVTAVAVDSGVSEQPSSIEETVTGAKNRARRALEATNADYGVGLEGGVARLEQAPGVRLIMWASVTDGERIEVASGPSLRLPDSVGDRLEEGAELGPVMDERLGTENIAEAEGAAGALTSGLTSRTQALAEAVACAFGPFVTTHYESD
ncbi:inosine/xanthosine triphosphatase [Halostagnicola sp. A-GB9-2]|uniref:inosine/xanthosine triphosphatase n=1 Tax=Halostagnicola sp. A-GB9-2 TaxID=3048066 RepID=UPI0024C0733D|nr:inosine/xanthosine triphosphatase [Halostagnicola sp. A-GB9-2]MDJ1431087.1 inosine/xanthosine triphosphatase [Halostagnicola sp. A-GB9-2]